MRLSNQDYITIVKHYGYDIPKNKNKKPNLNKTRKLAKDIIVNKLCNCIKKVQKSGKLKEPAAIAICNRSIFSRRNLKHYRFTCKKQKLLNKKGKKYALTKTKKVLNFIPKRKLKVKK